MSKEYLHNEVPEIVFQYVQTTEVLCKILQYYLRYFRARKL
jgi:hypothetical protein